MPKPRGRDHTTLTETAALVIRALTKLPDIKMIAPGEIKTAGRRTRGGRHVTGVITTAGLELIITGQSVQKVAVHTDTPELVFALLSSDKLLKHFTFSTRERKPGV